MNPIKVDLRAIVAENPRGNSPVMVACPCHNDPAASLAVYADHAYCYAMRRYFRRYESAALLLGLWDGCPETVLEAVRKVRPMLSNLPKVKVSLVKPPKPIDPSIAETFHRYLLESPTTLDFFKSWRGLTESTIVELMLGYTGSHFTIPVFGKLGEVLGMRYRMDPRTPSDGPKYSGLSGHNTATLYSMTHLCKLEEASECWVFEGEYDDAVGHQIGLPSSTITNGSGSLVQLPSLLVNVGIRPRRWVIATDQDEAGDKAAWELQQQLGSAAVRAHWDDTYKDITEFYKAGGTYQDILLT